MLHETICTTVFQKLTDHSSTSPFIHLFTRPFSCSMLNSLIDVVRWEFTYCGARSNFIIQIKNWQFCGKNDTDEECNAGDEGEFIDVTLVIKSKGKPKQKSENEQRGKDGKRRHPRCFRTIRHKKCPKQFDIGGDSEIVLSSQVNFITSLIRCTTYFDKRPLLLGLI